MRDSRFTVQLETVSGKRLDAVVGFEGIIAATQFAKNWIANRRDAATTAFTEGERQEFMPLGCMVWTRHGDLAAVVGHDYVELTLED